MQHAPLHKPREHSVNIYDNSTRSVCSKQNKNKSTSASHGERVHNNFTLFTSLVQVPKIIHEIMRS